MYVAVKSAYEDIPPMVPEHGEYQAIATRLWAEYTDRQATNTLGQS